MPSSRHSCANRGHRPSSTKEVRDPMLPPVPRGVEAGALVEGVLHGVDLERLDRRVGGGVGPVRVEERDAHLVAPVDVSANGVHDPLQVLEELLGGPEHTPDVPGQRLQRSRSGTRAVREGGEGIRHTASSRMGGGQPSIHASASAGAGCRKC